MARQRTRTYYIGERVETGEGEDFDTGRVIVASGDQVTVAWDSGGQTTPPVSLLRLARRAVTNARKSS